MFNTIVKLWVWSETPMSKDGYAHWGSKLRPFINKMVFRPALRIDASVWDIDTLNKLARFIYENCGASPQDGFWIVRRLSKAKTRTHYAWKRIAKLKIRSTGDAWTFTATDTMRFLRSWYVKAQKQQIHAENYEEEGEENE